MKLFGSMEAVHGELTIGGVSTSTLAGSYETPLYIMDEELIRQTAATYLDAFRHPSLSTGVIYAGKAFLCVAMAKLVSEMGLRLDVVSGGELYTALKALFPVELIYYHGNNKSDRELEEAVTAGVGTIVLDNRSEAKRLSRLLAKSKRRQRVLLRINPGIEAHTHDYIQTAKHDSKFGESLYDPAIMDVVSEIAQTPGIELYGFHCHVGSQIFEESTFFNTASEMVRFASKVEKNTGIKISTLNLGGGFGIYYAEGDRPFEPAAFLARFLTEVQAIRQTENSSITEILIEPGRSLIANAGTTLYTIGDIKETVGGRKYVFIDGGMTDNPRPALYQARYEAAIANRMDEPASETYTVAGKQCESGDILIKDIRLPEAAPGDLLAVASTGAYNYSMSSNYNRNARPAVVFVKDGKTRLAVRRETYDDILAQDVLSND